MKIAAMEVVAPQDYRKVVLDGKRIIDVRSPAEFRRTRLPYSINLPLFDDDERALIGETFRQSGRDEAIRVAELLLDDQRREFKIEGWKKYLKKYPDSVIASVGGGIRTELVQTWLAKENLFPPSLAGGVRGFKKFLRQEAEQFAKEKKFLLIAGCSGSGRSDLISEFPQKCCDLEKLANYHWATFGGYEHLQPAQTSFENMIGFRSVELSTSLPQKILLEDEGRMIGRVRIPESWYAKMRQSDLVLIDEPLSDRVERIFRKYILQVPVMQMPEKFQAFLISLAKISRKLGGVRYEEVKRMMVRSMTKSLMGDLHSNRDWIEKLLVYYFDPLYRKKLANRSSQIRFRGSYSEAATFLSQGE